MNLNKLLVVVLLLLPFGVVADPATYDDFWQRNNNVTIEKFQVYWDTSDTRAILSNGEICRITKADEELFSTALAMKAQQIAGEVICQKEPAAGSNERRLHRITY